VGETGGEGKRGAQGGHQQGHRRGLKVTWNTVPLIQVKVRALPTKAVS